MKEARKALETSSLGRKPRFRLSQLIQSVLMTKTTTDVREMSTVLQGAWGKGRMDGWKRATNVGKDEWGKKKMAEKENKGEVRGQEEGERGEREEMWRGRAKGKKGGKKRRKQRRAEEDRKGDTRREKTVTQIQN